MNKKGQYVRAWARQKASNERRKRVSEAGKLKELGKDDMRIAAELGVSVNTVKTYLKEHKHYLSLEKEERLERKVKEQKEADLMKKKEKEN